MSLYIGNLSPRVGKEELERAFGRFGRCDIRLKDGYGFAIYGIRAQAEVALRALRGRDMCGLPISLSWSNKQPNAPKSFNRGGRSYERQPGRGFGRRDDHINGALRSNAPQSYKFRQPDGEANRLKSGELPVEKESLDHVSEERDGNKSKKEEDQNRGDNADTGMLDSGRWGEFGRLSHDSHIEVGSTFDRYQPDREYEKTGQEGKEISEDKLKEEEAVNISRKNQACFKCGKLGHKMRDCPLQAASRVRRLARFNDRRDKIDSNGEEPSSRRRLSSTSVKEKVRGRKDFGSGKNQRVKRRRSSSVSTEYNERRKPYARRKQSGDKNGKRSKRSLSRSSSRSYSSSSASYSSSRLKSDSKLNLIKSRSVKSRSRSYTPLSLSVSLDDKVKSNGYLDILTTQQTKPDVMQENQHFENAAEEDNMIGFGNTEVDVQENQQLEIVCVDQEDDNDQHTASVKENLESYVPAKSDSKNRYTTRASYASISLDELDRVMKHYNLKHTEENEGHSSIEEYLGCARFWPWEIIYYRRLKKGSISTENYERRLAQNREFGITDKFVRSSSGWGEPIEEL